MNDLVEVNVAFVDEQFAVDSRSVAEHFQKRHDHVLRDIEYLKDVPNFGEMFLLSGMADAYGRTQKIYYLNRDGFSLLAMGFTGTDALNWKLKYIGAFNAMEKAWNSPEKIMARALQIADRKIMELSVQAEKDKPKVIFADAVATSKSSILVGELAKLLKQNGVSIGQNRLFEWFRANGFLIKRDGTDFNMPTQKSMEMGIFEIKETVIVHSDGHTRISKTPKINGRGQQYFVNKFLGGLQ